MKNKIIISTFALYFCAVGPALAQPTSSPDPISEALIGPEVVMSHQGELGLSDTQRRAIQYDILDAQRRFTNSQFELAGASEKLLNALKPSHVDQPKAMSALDDVLRLERDVKHAQLTLMIQIKNELTADQQARARTFAPQAQR